ncbi:MAG: translation initiation factor IF-2 [Patescibacteria group bacterium]
MKQRLLKQSQSEQKGTILLETFRPPIVSVLGHVDHGKTSLLDAIRKTNVAQKEAGGITQSIGASVITTKEGKKITFVDTPGHAAFSKLRSRGAKVSDIVLLVVAADDGVKPQTKESLAIIKAEKLPFIVVFTKNDLPTANLEKVKGELEKEGVAFEGRGGDVIAVSVSAKTGQGIEELTQLISLLAEIREIKGDPSSQLEGIIVEANKDKRGILVSVIVYNGFLKRGMVIYSASLQVKVKSLFDANGIPVNEIIPGEPGRILGFSQIPVVGSKITSTKQDTKEELSQKHVGQGQLDGINIILKTKTAGSLEAVLENIPKGFYIVSSGVSELNESDILLAKSLNAKVFLFGLKIPNSIKSIASKEGVEIEAYQIIYELIERLQTILESGKKKIVGKAEVIATFPFENKIVAGCRVLEGKIRKNDRLVLIRNDQELGITKALSIRKGKDKVNEIKVGEEFGVIFDPQLDFRIGDVILSVDH